MRVEVVAVLLALAAGGPAGAAGQSNWWDVGPGPLVENDFVVGFTYSPACVAPDRLEADPDTRGLYALWAAAADGGAVLPGGRACSYGVGLRLEGVHWVAPLAAFRVAVEGAWNWDVRDFAPTSRVWRFRRYGVDFGFRVGRALGSVRPWVDAGVVLGSGARFAVDPGLVRAPEPVFDPGFPAVDELLSVAPGFGFAALGVAGAGVDIGSRYGVRFAVRRSWALAGPAMGSRYLAGADVAWEVGPIVRF